jgi:hypothetical protein
MNPITYKDNKTLWKIHYTPRNGRIRNIITNLSGARQIAKDAKTPYEIWKLLCAVFKIIVVSTNKCLENIHPN